MASKKSKDEINLEILQECEAKLHGIDLRSYNGVGNDEARTSLIRARSAVTEARGILESYVVYEEAEVG